MYLSYALEPMIFRAFLLFFAILNPEVANLSPSTRNRQDCASNGVVDSALANNGEDPG